LLVAPRKGKNILIVNQIEYKKLEQNFEHLLFHFVVRTEGENGITIFKNNQDSPSASAFSELAHIEGQKVDVFDVTGAGDTVTATIAWYLNKKGLTEKSLVDACHVANYAASLVVSQHGTAVVKSSQLSSVIPQGDSQAEDT
jgi:bifunctional ADP-heptose synthase (sugar kinase/adenylyltransferase)